MPRGVLKKLALDSRIVSISADTPVLAIDGNLISSDGAPRRTASLREVMGLSPVQAGRGRHRHRHRRLRHLRRRADFVGRITAFYDFTRDGIATAPVDPYGHGTHIAGIIGSSGGRATVAIGAQHGSGSARQRDHP